MKLKNIFKFSRLKLTAFILAIILWNILINIVDPIISKSYKNVPIKVLNDSVILKQNKLYQINKGSNLVNVELKARRSILRKIKKKNIIVTANFKNISMNSLVKIDVSINNRYSNKVTEIKTNYSNLSISIVKTYNKKLPLNVKLYNKQKKGYKIIDFEVEPKNINIFGSKHNINNVKTAIIEYNIDGITHNKEISVVPKLYDSKNKIINNNLIHFKKNKKVKLFIKVEKEKKYE